MDSSNHLEKISLPYSKKDIGLPSKFQYQKRLTYAIEKFCRNLLMKINFGVVKLQRIEEDLKIEVAFILFSKLESSFERRNILTSVPI